MRTVRKSAVLALAASLVSALFVGSAASASGNSMIGINVVLTGDVSEAALADLATFGQVRDVFYEIDAVTLRARAEDLETIRQRPYVAAANADVERQGSPVDTVPIEDFSSGFSTWNQDAVNATVRPFGRARAVAQDGSGVYVAVLDSGLVGTWRQYFPEERIATEFGKAFAGGGQENGNVSEPTNMWEHAVASHGTSVTSAIIGYSFLGAPINGVAPRATIIPVKVVGQGNAWASTVAAGILYATNLKVSGALGDAPLVINMSLGGLAPDVIEKATIDYAVANGVIFVASAGNEGTRGMLYPGAYPPVISAAASGWVGQWRAGSNTSIGDWWFADDVLEPTNADDFYITSFSSRQKPDQDLDVAAPGAFVVGPSQDKMGQVSYRFLSGTSMAAPHVAGVAALMAQKNPALTGPQAEAILESTAVPLAAGCRDVQLHTGALNRICWGSDATGAGLVSADAALGSVPVFP